MADTPLGQTEQLLLIAARKVLALQPWAVGTKYDGDTIFVTDNRGFFNFIDQTVIDQTEAAPFKPAGSQRPNRGGRAHGHSWTPAKWP